MNEKSKLKQQSTAKEYSERWGGEGGGMVEKNLLSPKVERQKYEQLLKNNKPTHPPQDLI